MYLILRSLTSLLYVVHVCRGSLTSPLMHCILFFMWVKVLSSLLHVMHVYRIYIFIGWFVFTHLLMIWQKGGEVFWSLYMQVYFISLFYTKRGRRILIYAYMFCLYKKGRNIWWVDACLSPYLCIHFCLVSALHWIYIWSLLCKS